MNTIEIEKKIKIAPSLLASDYSSFGETAVKLKECGADYIHFDVMDGHFVPSLSFGAGVLRAIKKHTDLPVDVHLMLSNPAAHIDEFLDAGADIITFHIEAELYPQRLLERIKKAGRACGLVLNPSTPVSALDCVIQYCDMALIMSVNPGFGGQSFIHHSVNKIRELKELLNKRELDIDIEVDGGIDAQTAPLCKDAGANVLVAGSYLFKGGDMAKLISGLRKGEDYA